jgi:ubiquinone/menaquinone biosynthesis C-methylase UbiE
MKIKDWVYPEATEIDTARDLEIIREYLPKNKDIKILDAGGGIGRISIPLSKMGYKVILLDISRTALNFARKKAEEEEVFDKIEFVEGDVCDLKFDSNYFDFVIALRDVINYSPNPKKAAKELIRVLKPEGYLIVSVSNKVFWLTKIERWNYEFEKIKSMVTTKSMLTEQEFRELFEGLKIEKIIGSGYCSGNIPERNLDEKFLHLENFIGNDPELKYACEYLVLIGRKHG